VNSTSLADRVYDAVVDRLYSGAYRPGDSLNRQQIARDLGVSVGTVLIAINRLEADGFLQTMPRKGTMVGHVGFEQVAEQLLIREALECAAARLYCGEAVRHNWASLVSMAERLDSFASYNSESIRLDDQFHTRLIELTEYPGFIEHYKRTMQLSMFFSFLYFAPGRVQESRDSHQDLLTTLSTGDPDRAEQAVRQHIRLGRTQFYRAGKAVDSSETEIGGG